MSSIEVRVYSGADPSELLAVLDRTRDRQWTDALNETGAGGFSVWARHPKLLENPSIIEYGNVVRFALDDVEVFAFVIEKKEIPQVAEGEDGARWIKIQGRGVLALLESALVYPVGGLGGAAEREWMDGTAGAIMGELLDEALARGALAGVAYDFDDSNDSESNAFVNLLDLSERAGADLLRVALRHAELAVDVYMTPDLVLRYFNERGVDRTTGADPVTLRIADQLEGLAIDGEGVIKNTLLVEGPTGFVDQQDAGSATTYGRREGFLALGNARSSSQLTNAAARVLRVQASPLDSHRAEVLWHEGVTPYVDYDVGDWIIAPSITNSRLRERVRAITISEDEDGHVRATPELVARKTVYEARLGRWLKSISGGALGGSAAAASSPTADSGTAAAIDSAVDQHEATLPHFNELADLVDVDVTPVSDGDVLTFDTGTGKWVAAPPAGAALPVPALIAAGPVTWPNMPAAATELGGGDFRTAVDATNATEVRLVVMVKVAGSAGAVLRGRYSNGGAWADLGAAGEPEVSIATVGLKASGWAALVAGATEPISVAIEGEGGDGAADPELVNVVLQFR